MLEFVMLLGMVCSFVSVKANCRLTLLMSISSWTPPLNSNVFYPMTYSTFSLAVLNGHFQLKNVQNTTADLFPQTTAPTVLPISINIAQARDFEVILDSSFSPKLHMKSISKHIGSIFRIYP